jgi:neutral ceramidase
MYKIGTGKAEIKCFKPGVGMMGYGMPHHKAVEQESIVYARAFVVEHPDTGSKFVFVNTESAFVTIAMKDAVLKRLNDNFPQWGYNHSNAMFTAQHTHSAPGGYSHYAIYNMSIPGFQPVVFNANVDAIYDAVVAAEGNKKEGDLRVGSGKFEEDWDVAFNRSVDAYNQNPDVEKCAPNQTHLAMERQMNLIRFDGVDGKPMGQANFFGVHTTSLPNNRLKISGDNKGWAATYFEEYYKNAGNPDAIAIFAQEACGDISPNFHGKGKDWKRGKFKDDLKSCQFTGELQHKKAVEIFEAAQATAPLSGAIDCETVFADLGNTLADPVFARGESNAKTAPPAMGLAFIKGTPVDGKGIPDWLARITTGVVANSKKKMLKRAKAEGQDVYKHRLEVFEAQGNKEIVNENGERRVLGYSDVSKLFVPSFADPLIKEMKKQYRAGSLREHTWTPQILPLQIIVVGQLAIVGFPGEITTVAFRRLRAQLLETLGKRGVTNVIVATYANCYFGYCTTREEYDLQLYEGGHTPFGKWTCAAFQTHFQHIATEMLKPAAERKLDKSIRPPEFSEKELSLRTYH